MIGSTRWLHRFGLWAIVAWIFVLLAPVAPYGAYRIGGGGWGAAAAVGMALGVGALLFQPAAYVGRPLARPGEPQQADAPIAARAPGRQAAISTEARVSDLVASWSFFKLTTETSTVFLSLLCLMWVVVGMIPFAGSTAPAVTTGFVLVWPKMLGRAYSAPAREQAP